MTVKLQPDESHVHQAEEDYQKILAGLLKKTTDSARDRGFELNKNTDNNLRIFISGRETHKRDITPAYIDKLRQAIEAPKSLKGSVQIKIGNEMVYYVKDGVVVRDRLNLTQKQQQKVEVNQSSSAGKPAAASVNKPDRSLISHEQLVQKVNSLEESIKRQSAQFSQLEQNLAKISQSSSSVQNKSLSQWMSSTLSGIASSFKQVLEGWNNARQQVLGNIKQRVELLTRNSDRQQLRSLEKIVDNDRVEFEKEIKEIKDRLTYLQQSSTERSTTAERSRHYANKSKLEGSVLQDSKNQESRAEKRVKDYLNSNNCNPEEIVSAAEKLLEKIHSQNLDGSRFFRTGGGYLFEGKGNTISIYSPDGKKLITSKNPNGSRVIDISRQLKDIELSDLQKIANKIDRDLSGIYSHNKEHSKERKASLSRSVGVRQ